MRTVSPPLTAVIGVVIATAASAGPVGAQAAHADALGDVEMALTGDAIITRRLSVFDEPEFVRLREIITSATVGFTNLEVLFHDYGPDVIPAEQSGGTYMRASPEIARELTWMGFDMVSRANNHTMDYGAGGMRATTRAVEAAGLVHAGAGENLARARAPGYLDTPGGRVALISVASTFADAGRAGEQRRDVRGRPGLSPIRYRTTYVAPRDAIETLHRIEAALDGDDPDEEAPDTLRFMGETFVTGDEYGVETRAHAGDLAEITREVSAATKQANWVIVSSHSHEGKGSREVPADFVVELARAVVDAGADVFVAHGPHVMRGIEIYQGRPIFYSLANFIFQNETAGFQPADNYERYDLGPDALPGEFYDHRTRGGTRSFPANPAYWESVVAVPSFRGGELVEVRLHPVTLGHGLPVPQRGRPVLATGEQARTIIDDVRRLSEPFGTRVEFVDGVGVIRVGEMAATGGGR